MPEWMSLLPPFVAIAIAIWKKEVVLALTTGIWLAEALLVVASPDWVWPAEFWMLPLALVKIVGYGFTGMLERCVAVFADGGNARVLLFGLIVGALIELMQTSGGVSGFVGKLANAGLTRSKRSVSMLASLIGISIFVETSMSCLAAGVVSQKLFDRFQMSRARLAFLVDSTCAPVSVLILFNGWGAYIMRLVGEYHPGEEVGILAKSVPYNFYPLLILALVFYTSLTTRVHGPLRRVEETMEQDAGETEAEADQNGRAMFMLIPMAVLICGMFFFMWLTGKGSLLNGSGSQSVLWSVSLATVVLTVMLVMQKVFDYKAIVEMSYKGMGKLLPVVTIMLLSFAIGDSCKALHTGDFVASAVGPSLQPFLVAPLLFICAAIISFTTGTSWGTFAILIPVGFPLAMSLGLPPSFVLAAILGGGVYGDHSSPISDTTIISSLASGCDHLVHVRTQLPYATAAGLCAVMLYTLVGLVI